MADQINIGDVRRVAATFTDDAAVPTDPTVVKVHIRKPSDSTYTTYTYGTDVLVVRDSPGVYHADLDIDQSGWWHYEWQGEGAVTADDESSFRVAPQLTRR